MRFLVSIKFNYTNKTLILRINVMRDNYDNKRSDIGIDSTK